MCCIGSDARKHVALNAKGMIERDFTDHFQEQRESNGLPKPPKHAVAMEEEAEEVVGKTMRDWRTCSCPRFPESVVVTIMCARVA